MRFVMSPSPSANRSGPDLRRTSTESQRKGSGASITGSPTMVAAVSGASANDILADLSVLQKEVDELRGKYDMSKASQ